MALIGHWPLNGNTNDISGNNYQVTGSPTSDPNGKIGQTYNFSSARLEFDYRSAGVKLNNNISISFWIYINDFPSSRMGIFQTAYGAEFAINITSTGGLQWYYGTSGIQATPYTAFSAPSNTVEVGKWVHITLIRNVTDNTLYYYKNGIQLSSANLAYLPTESSTNFKIGFSYTGYLNGKLNDFRIYDHVLTDKEVQEIAKAKILHYTFDDFQEPTTNLVTNTNLDTGWSKGYCTGILWNDIDPPAGINSQVVSFYDANTNKQGFWYSYGDYAPQDPNTTYTVSMYIRTNDSNFRINFYTANNSEIGRYWSEYQTVPNDGRWHRVVWDTFTSTADAQSDSLSFQFEFGNSQGESQRTWFCAPQMEAKDHATPFVIGSRTAKVNDYSGFFNHSDLLTETNTPQWTSNAKIGTGAYIFNGTSSRITTPNSVIIRAQESKSYAAWIKIDPNWSIEGVIFGGARSTTNSFGINSNKTLFAAEDDSRITSSTILNTDQWYHVVYTMDYQGSTIYQKLYINGELNTSRTDSNYVDSYVETVNYVGYDDRFNFYFNGSIDDVRIYKSVLSDADILDLYETRAEIEESGVLYAKNILGNVEGTTNIITNQDITTWSKTNTTVTLTNETYKDMPVYKIQMAGSALSRFFINDIGSIVGNITHSIYYRRGDSEDQGGSCSLWIRETSFGTTYSTSPMNILDNQWHRVETSANLSTADNLMFLVYKSSSSIVENVVMYVAMPQSELKPYATPFTPNSRPAIELPSTIEFGANEFHESGTANFEDFSTVGITDGLVAYLPLEKDGKDYSLNNFPTATSTTLTFDGGYKTGVNFSNSFVTVQAPTGTKLSSYTYSFFLKITTNPNGSWRKFLERSGSGANGSTDRSPGFWFYPSTVQIHFQQRLGANTTQGGNVDSNTLNLNEWYHVVFVCDFDGTNTTLKSYINNSKKQQFYANLAPYLVDSDLRLLQQGHSIGGFKLFNRALTDEEVAIEYNTMFNNEVQIHESGVLHARDLKQF